jgi:hypothetical protein
MEVLHSVSIEHSFQLNANDDNTTPYDYSFQLNANDNNRTPYYHSINIT